MGILHDPPGTYGPTVAATSDGDTYTAAMINNERQSLRDLNAYLQNGDLVPGDFALSPGWGTTASVAVLAKSRDHRWQITITAGGTGFLVDPTFTLTLKATRPNAPLGVVMRNGGASPSVQPTWVASTTQLVVTLPGIVPVDTNDYIFAAFFGD